MGAAVPPANSIFWSRDNSEWADSFRGLIDAPEIDALIFQVYKKSESNEELNSP